MTSNLLKVVISFEAFDQDVFFKSTDSKSSLVAKKNILITFKKYTQKNLKGMGNKGFEINMRDVLLFLLKKIKRRKYIFHL